MLIDICVLCDEFLYLFGVCFGGRLIGYYVYLFNQVSFDQFGQFYQVQCDGVVVVDKQFYFCFYCVIDIIVVDWVENNVGVVIYLQC